MLYKQVYNFDTKSKLGSNWGYNAIQYHPKI